MAAENWTFWFNLTNFALGMITVLAVLVVMGAVGWDLFGLWVHKVRKSDAVDVRGINMDRLMAEVRASWRDSHSLTVPELGLTMADGGEKVEPSENESEKKSRK